MKAVFAGAVCCVLASNAAYAVSIGPGDVGPIVPMNHDTAPNIITVDLGYEAVLTPGTYVVMEFDTQFTDSGNGGLNGEIQPLVVADDGGYNYTPLATGDIREANYTTSSYGAMAFGSDDTFVLTQTTTVAAALYWNSPTPNLAIGYVPGQGEIFQRFDGANAPVDAVPISGGATILDTRDYQFQYTITEASDTTVPEPASIALLTGALGLCLALRRRRRA